MPLDDPSSHDRPTSAGASHAAPTVSVTPVPQPVPGQAIGQYTLLSKLGEGGFGIVWLGQRTEPFVQRVAIKVLKPGMDSAAVLARFEQERQALAMMDHPAIARVLDAGVTERGLPYFVMEHVQGEPITHYADRANLTLRQRVELFIPVCEAVQHAHMKGIIHRDLKPSNILVAEVAGSSGESSVDRAIPKVIDFGVAKALGAGALSSQTIHTELGQMVGTPDYMAPEQSGSMDGQPQDIDTRADVYSLGVVLYELLAGVLPFDPHALRRHGYTGIQRTLREVDPPTPSRRLAELDAEVARVLQHRRQEPLSQLARSLRAELEWIPLKAMRKARQERYDSAKDLAEDLRHYLAGQPLDAGPESAAYRARKFIRRNRAAAGATVAVAGALVLGLASTTVFFLRERQQRQTAQERQKQLEAIATFQSSMLSGLDPEAAGRVLVQRVRDQLKDPAAEPMLKRLSGTDLATDFIDRAMLTPALAAIERDFADQPLIDARLRSTILETMQRLGMVDRVLPVATEALRVVDEKLPGDARTRARGLANVGMAHHLTGQPELAEKVFVEAVDLVRRELPAGDPDIATALNNLGGTREMQGDFAQAETLYREAFEIQRRAKGDRDPDTLLYENNVGGALEMQGKYAEARVFYERVLAEATAARGDRDINALTALNNLAGVYETMGQDDRALEMYTRSLAVRRVAWGNDHPDTAKAMQNLAYMLNKLKRPAEAEPLLREAAGVLDRSVGPDHPLTLITRHNLTRALIALERLDEADAIATDVLARQRETLGRDHPDALITWNTRIGLLRRKGDVATADTELLEAATLAQTLQPGVPIRERLLTAGAERLEELAKAEPAKDHAARAAALRAALAPAK